MVHKKSKATQPPKVEQDAAANQHGGLTRQVQARQYRKAKVVGSVLLGAAAITAIVTFILITEFMR